MRLPRSGFVQTGFEEIASCASFFRLTCSRYMSSKPTSGNLRVSSGLANRSFAAKDACGWPAVRLEQTVFKTPFLGVPF